MYYGTVSDLTLSLKLCSVDDRFDKLWRQSSLCWNITGLTHRHQTSFTVVVVDDDGDDDDGDDDDEVVVMMMMIIMMMMMMTVTRMNMM